MEVARDIINDLAQNFSNPNVGEDLLEAINLGIAEGFCRNGDIEDGMALYKKVAVNNDELKKLISPEFIEKNRQLAQQFFKNKKYTNALIQYKRLLSFTDLTADEYLNLANCLIELGQEKAAVLFLHKYEELSADKKTAYGNIGEILGLKLKMYPEAISYIEKFLGLEPHNALAYNTLGHFYSEYYNDKYLKKQLECFLNANKFQPNNLTYIRNVIFACEKIGDVDTAEKFYQKLLKLNPTPLDYNYYGCFLINQGRLAEGYKYLEQRFFAPEVILEYPKWLDENKRLQSCENLSDNTVLLFHEGGYGDSIMYIRFIEHLKKCVKKIILFVPDKLIDLFKASGVDVDMYPMTEDLTKFDYDYNASLVDLPYIVSADIKSMPKPEGYLKASQAKITEYKEKYFNNSKLKIGISYCANPKYKNATKRDMPLKYFYPLARLENVELYSLQVKDAAEQIKHLPPEVKITDISKTFRDFEDAAAAMMNLDLVITIDNVILNLAGALGVKTFALFNRFPEYRWYKTNGNDVGWYKSVKPFCAKTFNGWEDLMTEVIKWVKG